MNDELKEQISEVLEKIAADWMAYSALYHNLRALLETADYPDELGDALDSVERVTEELDELKNYLTGAVEKI
ncbi:MAG: hypothetical protein PHI85_09240 [Victivallaceae bacterium]|nr:hypothetical protein [Victivallaceae bacterium]